MLDNCLNGEDAVSVSVGVSDEVGTAVVVGRGGTLMFRHGYG